MHPFTEQSFLWLPGDAGRARDHPSARGAGGAPVGLAALPRVPWLEGTAGERRVPPRRWLSRGSGHSQRRHRHVSVQGSHLSMGSPLTFDSPFAPFPPQPFPVPLSGTPWAVSGATQHNLCKREPPALPPPAPELFTPPGPAAALVACAGTRAQGRAKEAQR